MKPRFAVLLLSTLVTACAEEDPLTRDNFAGTVEEVRACEGSDSVVEGIDVSEYQPNVDWARVRASGRRFAFIRVSDGVRYEDRSFDAHWSGARSAGLLRGAYQFFRPGQDPIAQAELFVRKVGRLGVGDLPPVVDVESADGQSSATVVSNLRRWIERVRAGTGREPIVYAASGFWDGLSGTSEFGRYKLWVANYGVRCPYLPRDWSRWAFWQYSDGGSVPGIAGGVDVNVFNGTIDALQALAGGSSSSPMTSPTPGEGPFVDASTVFCPSGFSYEATSRLCANGTEVVGPFTQAMIATCTAQGGGASTCQGNRWSLAFARSIRGTNACPPGTTFDSALRHCREGDNVFGPFSRAEVQQCSARGGGAVCEGYRWSRAMLPASDAVFCPAGTSFDATYKFCASATEAVGPFSAAMVARCIASGGGTDACRSDRWQLGFARSIRGTAACPPGATPDAASSNHCREGDDVFGPFTYAEVDACKSRGGGAVCEGYRWHASFVRGATSTPGPMMMGGGSNNPITVPYFYQYNNANEPGGTCGVTSAAMVLGFFGQTVTPDQLYTRYGKPSGQSPSSLVGLYERHGLRGAYTYNGTEAMIRAQIDAGRPVITHGYFTGAGHVLVIVGYDSTGFFVNDPAGRWRGCVRCGYAGTSTSTNGLRAHYDYASFRAAAAPDGNYWLSVASRTAVSF
ncbi:MAG: C39 family peptidase [Myxococcales bacterium]|nr:C39 family peptidase [Myxococcales bacterium]